MFTPRGFTPTRTATLVLAIPRALNVLSILKTDFANSVVKRSSIETLDQVPLDFERRATVKNIYCSGMDIRINWRKGERIDLTRKCR